MAVWYGQLSGRMSFDIAGLRVWSIMIGWFCVQTRGTIGDKVRKAINLSVVLYGCESWSETWRLLDLGEWCVFFRDVTRGLGFARLRCGTGVGTDLPTRFGWTHYVHIYHRIVIKFILKMKVMRCFWNVTKFGAICQNRATSGPDT